MKGLSNYTDGKGSLWRLNSEMAQALAPNTVVFVVYVIIGIIGNLISIYIYRCRMKHTDGKRYFILCLSITDLVTCSSVSGFAIYLNFLPLTFKGNIFCKIMWTFNAFLTISSAFLLLLIAVHRYRLICVPLGKPFNQFWRKFALISTYLLAFILSHPNLAFYGEGIAKHPEYNITGTTCGKLYDQQHSGLLLTYNYAFIVIFAVGATAFIVLYSFIGKTILKRSHTLMFMLITFIFLISYTPRMIIMIMENINPFFFVDLSVGQYLVYSFCFRLYIVNNIVNPFLYGVFDIEFRSLLYRMLPIRLRQTKPKK
ncbi:hypothetical protein KUTeg_019246 [Tegillarca granosa]|uniref:G-protein coupled receptors family 1 profile domain-containing protein n=1 Tax=Tegillarca granosa TaxID=220873 RepID=A0ABQ9EHE4_TEGGR|nr:hypothetical protein KUTeg_019246 [Tegillarca granosa]